MYHKYSFNVRIFRRACYANFVITEETGVPGNANKVRQAIMQHVLHKCATKWVWNLGCEKRSCLKIRYL